MAVSPKRFSRTKELGENPVFKKNTGIYLSVIVTDHMPSVEAITVVAGSLRNLWNNTSYTQNYIKDLFVMTLLNFDYYEI